ncbi:hypothetical protein PR048_032918 [Dryococelus australis]|uniref:Uncharacterized protein n=1 Tax=Dryococelus australis TaxID=614101 RepID=A0ABQ9G6F1_9NEOP|nr:hypothetical protein PR048_032918 [Dryococelus australis]
MASPLRPRRRRTTCEDEGNCRMSLTSCRDGKMIVGSEISAYGTMPLVGGFSRGLPVPFAFSFLHCSILNSFTLIGSQNLAVKSRPKSLRSLRGSLSNNRFRYEISTPMRVIEASMEQLRNERTGETGDPRENPPTNGIVRHDSHMRKLGVTRPGVRVRGRRRKGICGTGGWTVGALSPVDREPRAGVAELSRASPSDPTRQRSRDSGRRHRFIRVDAVADGASLRTISLADTSRHLRKGRWRGLPSSKASLCSATNCSRPSSRVGVSPMPGGPWWARGPMVTTALYNVLLLCVVKGALQELKLFANPGAAEVQCDNSMKNVGNPFASGRLLTYSPIGSLPNREHYSARSSQSAETPSSSMVSARGLILQPAAPHSSQRPHTPANSPILQPMAPHSSQRPHTPANGSTLQPTAPYFSQRPHYTASGPILPPAAPYSSQRPHTTASGPTLHPAAPHYSQRPHTPASGPILQPTAPYYSQRPHTTASGPTLQPAAPHSSQRPHNPASGPILQPMAPHSSQRPHTPASGPILQPTAPYSSQRPHTPVSGPILQPAAPHSIQRPHTTASGPILQPAAPYYSQRPHTPASGPTLQPAAPHSSQRPHITANGPILQPAAPYYSQRPHTLASGLHHRPLRRLGQAAPLPRSAEFVDSPLPYQYQARPDDYSSLYSII